MMKKVSFYSLVAFYLLAGFNHFRDPEFYYPLIPDYIGNQGLINTLSGIIEIFLGLGLAFSASRKWSVYLIIAMLVAFIPSHIHFIQLGGCVSDGLCVPAWIAWGRLIIIHPLLVLWAWNHRNYKPSSYATAY